MEEAPSITNIADEDAAIEYPEIKNSSPNTDPVFTYTASDDEDDNKALKWSVTPPEIFSIEGGVLRFKSPPNYEELTPSLKDNGYILTVTVTDTAEQGAMNIEPVTVKVKNVNEPGEITLGALQPKEEVPITAR